MDECKNESRDTRAKMRTENLFLSLKNSIFSKKTGSRQKCLEISLINVNLIASMAFLPV